MSEANRYICIDLKSYYASVECVDRGLDPLTTNLVVADESRSDKTICLAVSPSLKAMGVPGRPRLFEVKEKLREIKAITGKDVKCIIARPRMSRYLELSAEIYGIYLKYLSAEDMHVYSVDETFMDATHYLKLYKMSAYELAMTMVRDVLSTVGITATAGIGTNLYLAKIAMDIVAKKMPADKDGVRVAELNEQSYREDIWPHRPLTDVWQIGSGIATRLAKMGIYNMGELARLSIQNEDILFKEFGVDAEILIDHAWGIEPCGIKEIKDYKPETKSMASGQVLPRAYSFEEGKTVIKEMAEDVSLSLVDKGFAAEGLTLYVGYEALGDGSMSDYKGPVKINHYGKKVPPSVHGTSKLINPTASQTLIVKAIAELYDRIVDEKLCVRRLSVAAIRLVKESELCPQINLFSDIRDSEEEVKLLRTTLKLHKRYGKNAVIKGHDLLEAATTIERNGQIGGHKK